MSFTLSAAEPKHVFVIDDEPAAREMVGDYLTLQGFAVTLLDGGTSLRTAIGTRLPDLVLLDLNMPEEDGLSILRFVKQVTRVPVILVTATASPVDRIVGLEMGADDYVVKPLELRELLARIRAVLRRGPATATRTEDRRLAAVVSFDQVGFSRAVQSDEAAALAQLEHIFAAIIEPGLQRHRGVLFKKLGDGALIEFASALDALEWATAFQQAVHDLPVMLVRGPRPQFRVGVAIGDIILSGSDRLGETVALAARVQEAAGPGTVTISEFTYRIAGPRIPLPFTDRGLVDLKNFAEPMRMFEWKPG